MESSSGKGNRKENPIDVAPIDNVISIASLAQRARRERERYEGCSARQLAQRFRRDRERSDYKRSVQMQSHSEDASSKVKKEDDFTISSPPIYLDNTPQKSVEAAPLEEEEDKSQEETDEDDQYYEYAQNQLVLYDPGADGTNQSELIPDSTEYLSSPFPSFSSRNPPSRVLPSVGAFTVQCANCFKWRLIPTKEKYEEIRENISQYPFICETAREWRPEISCDDPADISQDGSRIWAIDKPNIAQPPPGWERLLRIRGEGGTRFADVYYIAPTGKKLRSTVEIQKYLLEHPEYIRAGVTLAQFSFLIPKPLQENYVKKRPVRMTSSSDGTDLGVSRTLEPTEANPLSWASPVNCPEFPIGGPELSTSYFEAPVFDPVASPAKKHPTKSENSPAKKRKTNSLLKQIYSSNSERKQPKIKIEEPQESSHGAFDL